MRIKLGSSVDVAENLTFSLGYSLCSELVSQMLVHEQKNHQRPSDKQCEANGKAFLDLVAIGMKLCGTITSRNPKNTMEWHRSFRPVTTQFKSLHLASKVMCKVFWESTLIFILKR